jgi:hypothetical protein
MEQGQVNLLLLGEWNSSDQFKFEKEEKEQALGLPAFEENAVVESMKL